MCTILGLGLLKGCTLADTDIHNIMRNLFMSAMGYNDHAAGMAIVTDRSIDVIKKDIPAKNLINLPEYDKAEETHAKKANNLRLLLGHCRYQTKGDRRDNKNNHPIIRDNVVGVHNGCLSNDDALFDKHSKDFNRYGFVDSEILFALIDHYSKFGESIKKAVIRTSNEVIGSLSCSMIHRYKPSVLWLFRKTNGCDLVIFEKVGLIAWATNGHYIESATRDYREQLGKAERISYPINSGLAIDTHRARIHNFKLD